MNSAYEFALMLVDAETPDEALCTSIHNCSRVALWQPVYDPQCPCVDQYCQEHRASFEAWRDGRIIDCKPCGTQSMVLLRWVPVR